MNHRFPLPVIDTGDAKRVIRDAKLFVSGEGDGKEYRSFSAGEKRERRKFEKSAKKEAGAE